MEDELSIHIRRIWYTELNYMSTWLKARIKFHVKMRIIEVKSRSYFFPIPVRSCFHGFEISKAQEKEWWTEN